MKRFPALLPPTARQVAERFSYGVTPELASQVKQAGGIDAWFDAQLKPGSLDNLRALAVPTWFPGLLAPPAVVIRLADSGIRGYYRHGTDLIARSFARRVLSDHQVYETMVDFWSNLLYVPVTDSRSLPWRADYDDMIRQHALGTYRDLLAATVVHPAMSRFLTNDLNAKGAINENLGRELLELHTVGRAAYTEDDVVASALLLTGYTVDGTTGYAGYDTARHWTGKVKVLGFKHPNADADGRAAVAAYLDYLAMHPATARRIAQRLCVRFVSDNPPASIVRAVAKTYLRRGSDIKACLRTLVQHKAFTSGSAIKARTPSDDVVHTARVLSLTPSGAPTDSSFVYQLVNQANAMGQVSLRWPAPDGWAEQTQGYLAASRVLRSWQVHLDLAGTSGYALIDVDVAPKSSTLPSSWPLTLAEVVDHSAQRIVGQRADKRLIGAVAEATGIPAATKLSGPDDLSDWQYQLLRGTVLNSPAGLQR